MGDEIAAPADPPFAIGQRVRCNVRTIDRRVLFHAVELYGRRGTVVRVMWLPLTSPPPGYWLVSVDYDLGRDVGVWRHPASELVPAEDWRWE